MRWGTPWYSCGTKNGNFTLVIKNGEVSSCTIGNAYIFSGRGSGSWDYDAEIKGMTITSITIE